MSFFEKFIFSYIFGQKAVIRRLKVQ